ncbi:glycosyl hydrolase 2 galactose-binding domain-containing protein [Sphingobium yanoikuyae]|uniref:glycosyl hydrolase 2 galactose-binding domain-containing protein n=1 Tax=Sphingobium yanoikuyae TaxID=13690 RepID=UPI0035C6F951
MRAIIQALLGSSLIALGGMAIAQQGDGAAAPYGAGATFNAIFMEGGIGIDRAIAPGSVLATAGAPLSLTAWVRPDRIAKGDVALLQLGALASPGPQLLLRDGRPAVKMAGAMVAAPQALVADRWTHVSATIDHGQTILYVDGRAVARGAAQIVPFSPQIHVAPAQAGAAHFGGALAGAGVATEPLTDAQVAAAAAARPDFDLIQFWHVGAGWEWQSRANTGLWKQQDAWTLPQGRGGYSRPVARPASDAPALEAVAADRWRVNGWQLAAAPGVKQDGAALSRPGNPSGEWRAATVPGTVLTTLVDRGVYPDPYYGLNNMAIPESLARQDYWYRTRFILPADAAGKKLTILFNGINYAGEAWANGQRLGATVGAFTRGQFAFTAVPGENVVAVRVSPPPHPGIPHEQSIKAGVGENGGQLAIDGPTFVATEGWDWIPGIRDRNTGLWQGVELQAHGNVRILDPHVVTDLPLPRTDSADIFITVPVRNDGTASRRVTVRAAFDDVVVEKAIDLAPGAGEVRFAPTEFAALRVRNPRLWWPNGYGDPALHRLDLTASVDGAASDHRSTRFGIREVSYDLSLFDAKGALRRVNVQTTNGGLSGQKLIDVRHEAIKQSPKGWAESLTAAGEASPAVTALGAADTLPEPHLTIRVNGVKIAARGGNWGMDDAMKRISRDRLEPYFRLEKEAHMNIIRNWMGTNTEPEFYDLADEYGMMVLNDFWQSTQNFQVEPQDPQLFLANARDTVSRYRNHPSIILWFGRNEGVPYPLLNEKLDDLVFELDGTRWFTGSSNTVNLQGSGPYNYRAPEGYFTDLASGFSVETGTPSLSTLESVVASVPQADLWPLSDTLAYHDWHFSGNGDTKTFMSTLATMFGPATSFEDFERKAQMMNLETHKAMYEGFLGHLWTKNSGRLLWMTHPAWPSNAWQIHSWDYDTHGAYYGAKKAVEPVHVQLNLPGNELIALNTTRDALPDLTASVKVVSLDNRTLFSRSDRLDLPANQRVELAAVPLDRLFASDPMLLVSLRLTDKAGKLLSENFYWRGKDEAAYRALDGLQQVRLGMQVGVPAQVDGEQMLTVTLANDAAVPVLNAKLTLLDARGTRILPAYYSDNYVALLPGEKRSVTIRYPAGQSGVPSVTLRGWNVVPQSVAVGQ